MLKDNAILIFELINYRWSQILESYNTAPRICKKVRIIDEEKIRRKPLSRYIKYLDVENPEHICFICGQPVNKQDLAIDHVLPWSYLYSDNLWNLVYVHGSCNSSKSNNVPLEETVHRLEQRNIKLFSLLKEATSKDKIVAELKFANEHNLVRKFWVSCQG
ncbi:hypothetical protein N752_24495 [Desulforamulus aquiferis]|nr:HNH endonuclease domain-containing protein [Desulforamulus aquiferis]RYD02492.1 hypothetical protein N752_24495 [Desulforamulus aquiferis]